MSGASFLYAVAFEGGIVKYMQDPEAQRTAAYGQLAALLPALIGAMEQAGIDIGSQLRRVK